MARNRIQFQKGLSEARFGALYGSEELCRTAIARWRWPDGFVCPKCGGREHCIVGPRKLDQCNACRRQTSPTAGTIFDATKVPLTTWFRAMDLITQTKQGISSIELGRRLGTTQTTAWKIKTKLAEAMRRVNDRAPLDGRIEMDDAYLGGERGGGKTGRGSPGKKPIVVAVQTDDEGRPRKIKLRRRALQAPPREEPCPAHHRTGCHRGDRRPRLLPWCCRRRLRACGAADWRRPTGRAAPGIPLGQHDARQHQDRDRRDLPCRAQEAPRANSRRVRMALQSSLRPRGHDPRPRSRRRRR